MNCDINVYFIRIDILVILLWFCSSSHLFVWFLIFYDLNKYSLHIFFAAFVLYGQFVFFIKIYWCFFPTENSMLLVVLFQLRVFWEQVLLTLGKWFKNLQAMKLQPLRNLQSLGWGIWEVFPDLLWQCQIFRALPACRNLFLPLAREAEKCVTMPWAGQFAVQLISLSN